MPDDWGFIRPKDWSDEVHAAGKIAAFASLAEKNCTNRGDRYRKSLIFANRKAKDNAIMKTKVIITALILAGVLPAAEARGRRALPAEAEGGNLIVVDATSSGDVLPNIVSNVNVWHMGTLYHNPRANAEANVFDFVEYVQFMQCTGGNKARDLFIDPEDRTTLTDYKFDGLIENCRGVIALGAKPHLKLGSVPIKLTSHPFAGTFATNIYPPDDYGQYYAYIRAIAEALVGAVGRDEVRMWHFGVMTEYENYDWFKAYSDMAAETDEDRARLADESFVAYCKLYDYTVQALIDVLGEDIYVGAHSMTVTEGGWDETRFIRHVANGVNYANGGRGTRLSYLAASFYDYNPGHFTPGHDLPGTIRVLRDAADAAGLKDLKFGIDEGRILAGIRSGSRSQDLYNRTCGYTWQAAYDARLYKQGLDAGLDYFSSWNYLTGGNIEGYPIISYHVAREIAKFAGEYRVDVRTSSEGGESDSLKAGDGSALNAGDTGEMDCLAATDGSVVRTMVYNFRNDPFDEGKAGYTMQVRVPFRGRKAEVTRYLVSDDCNFFDEWLADCDSLGITAADFGWSPDDPMLDSPVTLSSAAGIAKYKTRREYYKACARLTPVTDIVDVRKGVITFTDTLDPHTVLFMEIRPTGKAKR
jgi:hypothetical protein